MNIQTNPVNKKQFACSGGIVELCGNKIETVEDTIAIGNAMAKDGHFPAGLDPCFVAGINGEFKEDGNCLFDGEDFCECKYLEN